MSEPVDWDDETLDYLKVQLELPKEYLPCSQCIDGECEACDYLKSNKLGADLANRLRPRMPFPF